MQKTDERTLREIERIFERYKREVDDSELSGSTKEQYQEAADYFVRWIRGTYTPGQGPWQ